MRKPVRLEKTLVHQLKSIRMVASSVFMALSFSWAQAEVKNEGRQPHKGSIEANLIDYNEYLSKKFESMANEIDLYLSQGTYTTQENPSDIRLSYFTAHEEGGDLSSSFHFNVNLRLPNLEKRWAVSFTSYDEDAESRGVRAQQQRLQPKKKSYGAGVALLQELGNIKASFRPRIQLTDPLETRYTLRLESAKEVNPYQIVPRVEFFGDSEKGTGEFVALSMELSSSETYSLVWFNEETYEDAKNFFSTTHGLSAGKALTSRLIAGPTISFYSTNREAYHLEDFTASIGLNHQPFRKVFHYSITPFWRFSKIEDFKGKVGISLETEIIF